MNMPKVSVLMPVYNADKYLAEAIDSIIDQTFTDWELILVDDGSTDNSKAIVDRYNDCRIRYLANNTNQGLITTLNVGIQYCSGTYIARMDADDIALPDRLARQAVFLDKHPEYAMCGTNAITIDSSGGQTGHILNLTNNDYLQINLLFSVPFIHPTMMIRKSILTANSYDEQYKHIEDYDLWCRIAAKEKVANINHYLLKYRWHTTNISVIHTEKQKELKDKIVCRELLSNLDIVPTEQELYCHQITFRLYAFGKPLLVTATQFDEVEAWFYKLIERNKVKCRYNKDSFVAYLWARWCVLCISQKRYLKMVKPSFSTYRPTVLIRLVKLILSLSRK